MKAAKGHVFKYGDNVDTDVIIPARYLNSSVQPPVTSWQVYIHEPHKPEQIKTLDAVHPESMRRSLSRQLV